MGGDRLAQLGQAAHRRILARRAGQRRGGALDHVLGPAEIGEALAEIDRLELAREPRHMLEDGGRQVGEERVHAAPYSAAARLWRL
jgi:hypothetical protein